MYPKNFYPSAKIILYMLRALASITRGGIREFILAVHDQLLETEYYRLIANGEIPFLDSDYLQ